MAYQFDFAQVVSGEYGQWLVQGCLTTLKISAISIVCSLILGTVVAVLRLSKVRPLVWASASFTEFFRNTPLLVQIFFWYFGSYNVLPMDLYRQEGETFVPYLAANWYQQGE